MPRLVFLFLVIVLITSASVNIKAKLLAKQDSPSKQNFSEVYQMPEDVKNALAQQASTGTSILGVHKDGPVVHIPILMYHYIEYVQDQKDTIRKSLNIVPATFDKQLQTMVEGGYTFLTASDVANILDGVQKTPEKGVVLTFDDGYRDFYTDAYPILKKYHARAVAYVVPGFLGKANNLDKWMLEEIAKSGLIEIGAHTVNHKYLTALSEIQAKQEIEDSKLQLEQELDTPITSFAYPYGAFNLKMINLVRQAGFRLALSTLPGAELDPDHKFFLVRVRPGYRTGPELLNYLQGSYYK